MKFSYMIMAWGFIISAIGRCAGQDIPEEKENILILGDQPKEGIWSSRYNPSMRLRGDTLYLSTGKGLYMKNLQNREESFSLVAFERFPVVDFVKSGNRYVALTYGIPFSGRHCLFLSEGIDRMYKDITPALILEESEKMCGGYMLCIADNPENPSSFFINQQTYRLYQTFDFGKTWRSMRSQALVPFISYHPLDTTLIYQTGEELSGCTINAPVCRSKNNGDSWQCSFTNIIRIQNLAFHPQKEEVMLYAAMNAGIGRSTDQGKTWSLNRLSPNYGVTKIVFDRDHPDTVYGITQVRYYWQTDPKYAVTLYRSVDEGETWNEYHVLWLDFEETGVCFDVLYYNGNLLFYMENGLFCLNPDEKEWSCEWRIPSYWNASVPETWIDSVSFIRTSVERNETAPQLTVVSNPVREALQFETSENVRRIEIADMTGRTVKRMRLSETVREIGVGNLRAGMYVVYFLTDRGSIRKKIVVAR